MPAPLPLAVRRLIQRRARRGQSAAAIACAPWASARALVRQLLRHFGEQLERLEPAYQPGPGQPADRHPLYALALALRQQHPGPRAAGYIRVRLAGAADAAVLPSERTLQRWFRQQHQPPAAPGRRPSTPTSRATAPHDTWQMDAVEQLRLGSGQGVCWLRLVDEYSGAFLGTTVSPLPVGPCPADRGAAAACGRRSPAGGLPCQACVWTTASRGVRGAICLRPWRAVADRLGHRHDLERPVLPSAERGRRAFAGDSEALGGAPHLWQCSRTANPAG